MITKEKWVSIMKACGLSEEQMHRWHAEFERSAPEEHQEFLEFLHIPPRKSKPSASTAARDSELARPTGARTRRAWKAQTPPGGDLFHSGLRLRIGLRRKRQPRRRRKQPHPLDAPARRGHDLHAQVERFEPAPRRPSEFGPRSRSPDRPASSLRSSRPSPPVRLPSRRADRRESCRAPATRPKPRAAAPRAACRSRARRGCCRRSAPANPRWSPGPPRRRTRRSRRACAVFRAASRAAVRSRAWFPARTAPGAESSPPCACAPRRRRSAKGRARKPDR